MANKSAKPSTLLLDEAQAAAVLSMSPRKLWELAECGAIASVKIGKLKRYRREDLEGWVSSGCPTKATKARARR